MMMMNTTTSTSTPVTIAMLLTILDATQDAPGRMCVDRMGE